MQFAQWFKKKKTGNRSNGQTKTDTEQMGRVQPESKQAGQANRNKSLGKRARLHDCKQVYVVMRAPSVGQHLSRGWNR